MVIRNASFPEVLEPFIDDMLDRFSLLQPATLAVKVAIDNEMGIKADIAAALVVVWHQAKRTNTYESLYNNFKNAKGANDQIKFINYLTDGRLVNERMVQAVNEMGSVLTVIAPHYSLIEEPSISDVLAEIHRRGTVADIHNKHEYDEKLRVAEEQAESDRRAHAVKEELARSRGMTYEEYVAFERSEKQREQHARNAPKRQRLLETLLRECDILRIDVDAPDGTVLVKHQGKVLVLSTERSMTVLDVVS